VYPACTAESNAGDSSDSNLIGANIGTTTTALIGSIKMQNTARREALANLIFNVVGVLLFSPFLRTFALLAVQIAGDPRNGGRMVTTNFQSGNGVRCARVAPYLP
jgi:phosphate:Na+ symporter